MDSAERRTEEDDEPSASASADAGSEDADVFFPRSVPAPGPRGDESAAETASGGSSFRQERAAGSRAAVGDSGEFFPGAQESEPVAEREYQPDHEQEDQEREKRDTDGKVYRVVADVGTTWKRRR